MAGFYISNLPPIATTPTAYTPAISSTSGFSGMAFYWSRIGPFMNIDGQILFGASSAVSTPLTLGLPNNNLISTSVIPGGTGTSNPIASLFGIGYWFDAGVAWKAIWPKFVSATLIGFWDVNQAWANSECKPNTGLNFIIRVPIQGWF